MKGLCVEITNGPFDKHRGIVRSILNEIVFVELDSKENIRIPTTNLCSVYTLGLPREVRMKVKGAELTTEVISNAVKNIDSTKFFLAYLGSDGQWQHFAKVRTLFVERMLQTATKQDKEPLLRVYVSDYSQDDPGAKILFGDSIVSCADAPAIADFDAEWVVECATLSAIGGQDMAALNLRYLMIHVTSTSA